jgi:hypothetical protein
MDVFGSDEPRGDAARQAVDALRGYAYQLYATGLAWLGLGDGERLYLEVAEDYAVASREALAGTQVKDTAASGRITLQSQDVRAAIDAFVDLVARNPGRVVSLHYLTTAEIGRERSTDQRVDGEPALKYWRRAAAGADVAPLRAVIAELDLNSDTKAHLAALSDDAFRQEFLSRIHWNCGAPGLNDVRADLEAGLIEYVASARGLSSDIGRKTAPTVIERLLITAASSGLRKLRRADLLDLIDEVSRVSVPVDHLLAALQARAGTPAFSRQSLLVDLPERPLPKIIAPRAELVSALDHVRRAAGIAVACGATGLGKSFAARLVAERAGGRWATIDFRDLNSAETVAQLSRLLGELAASPATSLILDDLNEIDDPSVRDMLVRFGAALLRRDETAIITTYRAPTGSTLHQISLGSDAVVDIPYLSISEVGDLVAKMGGEEKYGQLVYFAGDCGHPGITMTVLQALAASNWSRASLARLLGNQPQAGVGSERQAARQRLANTASPEAQRLLFRVSMIAGSFDRALALTLGELPPAVPLPGLELDRLVGPWIEPAWRDRFRISPLLRGVANDVFSAADCRAIHQCIAAEMLRSDTLSVIDVGTVLHHALRSEEAIFVVAFAQSIIASDNDTLEMLAPFAGELAQFDTDTPIFPQDLTASAVLRVAQLLVLLPKGSPAVAQRCWDALEREKNDVENRDAFEAANTLKILLHPRAGELLSDWVEMLVRFDTIIEKKKMFGDMFINIQKSDPGAPHVAGVLLANQMGNITSAAKFRDLLERLDQESSETRQRLLSAFRAGDSDIGLLVNQGWHKGSTTDGFDGEAAANDYAACAEIAVGWQDSALSTRCVIAQAICLDEYGDEPDTALACLSEAEQRFGFDTALARARAKVHWRRRDYSAALPLLTRAAQQMEGSPVERAFIAREAAISAAQLGEWTVAQTWFDRLHEAACQVRLPSMQAMGIGALADAAHAAYHAGHPEVSILRLRDALIRLPSLDPDGTLPEAHCHRVVRHAVLWLLNELTDRKVNIEQNLNYPVGCASNPEPVEEIRSHPLSALDMAFYLLADADEALPSPTGFYREFRDYLIDGQIFGSIRVNSARLS